MRLFGRRVQRRDPVRTIRYPAREPLLVDELPAARPLVDVEAVELAERLLKERDEARAELARVRKRYDQAQLELLQASTLAQRLATQVTRLEVANEELHNRTQAGEVQRLSRQAEQDRRNAVVLEDRLAAAEGRPPASSLPGRSR